MTPLLYFTLGALALHLTQRVRRWWRGPERHREWEQYHAYRRVNW